MSYIVGGVYSFILNRKFTFRVAKNESVQVLKFVVNMAVCYLIAYGVAIKIVVKIINGSRLWVFDSNQIAMIFGMLIYTVLNFFGQKEIVFGNIKLKH